MDKKALYINLNRLSLRVDRDEGVTYIMRWGFRENNPRLSVMYLKNGTYDVSKSVIVPFNTMGLMTFLGLFNSILDKEPGTEFSSASYNAVWENGQKTDKIDIQSTAHIGKDENGIIYLRFTAGNNEALNNIKFYIIVSSKWFSIYKNGEKIVNKSALSRIAAESYLKTLESCFSHLFILSDISTMRALDEKMKEPIVNYSKQSITSTESTNDKKSDPLADL